MIKFDLSISNLNYKKKKNWLDDGNLIKQILNTHQKDMFISLKLFKNTFELCKGSTRFYKNM